MKGGIRLETSIYLDLARIAAVALVLLDHLKRDIFVDGFLMPLAIYGQEAVAIFFVLSGLVIANATFSRKQDLGSYLIARLARLWSVVVPAVALTAALDVVGSHVAPQVYTTTWASWHLDLATLWQALSPILFLNSVPRFNVFVGSNGPFWSLSYEAWYYFAFGLAVFMRGWARIFLLLALSWFVGVGILALAPLWLMGVGVNAMLGRGGPARWAWAGWLGSVVALAALLALKYKLLTVLNRTFPPEIAQEFVEKYLVALLASANILCFDRIGPQFAKLARRIERPVRSVVSRSFSMYLYQAPLLFFIAALAQGVTSRPLRAALFTGGTVAAVAVLAEYTERRKSVLFRWLRPLAGSHRSMLIRASAPVRPPGPEPPNIA